MKNESQQLTEREILSNIEERLVALSQHVMEGNDNDAVLTYFLLEEDLLQFTNRFTYKMAGKMAGSFSYEGDIEKLMEQIKSSSAYQELEALFDTYDYYSLAEQVKLMEAKKPDEAKHEKNIINDSLKKFSQNANDSIINLVTDVDLPNTPNTPTPSLQTTLSDDFGAAVITYKIGNNDISHATSTVNVGHEEIRNHLQNMTLITWHSHSSNFGSERNSFVYMVDNSGVGDEISRILEEYGLTVITGKINNSEQQNVNIVGINTEEIEKLPPEKLNSLLTDIYEANAEHIANIIIRQPEQDLNRTNDPNTQHALLNGLGHH